MSITGSWDKRISRRTLLRTGGAAAAGALFLGRSARPADAAPLLASNPFGLGVASGDPTPDGIVLWTRLTPELREGVRVPEDLQLPDRIFNLRYEVATDERFGRIVRRGTVAAPPLEAYTAHAEVGGLRPDTRYWYRFRWGPVESPIGRTRTAPAAGSSPAALRFAFASCQNYTNGYYTAYADMARQDLDLVVHLGDYIYEGSGLGATNPGVRLHAPASELFTLEDYRTRHAQYRTDPNLQAAHAAFPWLMTWDDHEFKDQYADLAINPETPLATVAERRAAAYLAYWEHAPLARSRKPVGKDMPLFRRVAWGSLATFHVLDTRQHRSDQIVRCAAPQRTASGYCPDALDPARSILGTAQRDWLLEGLGTAGGSWNVLANQVPFAPRDSDRNTGRVGFDLDQWDGYVTDRQLILDFLRDRGLLNTVVITGDAHVNSVRNVPPDFSSFAGVPLATEFVGTSISSGSDETIATNFGGGQDPHHLFSNNNRGYVRVLLDPAHWTSEFRIVSTVRAQQATASTLATFMVDNGKPGAYAVSGSGV